MSDHRPRCPAKACPVRYRGGPDRMCPEHQADAADVDLLAASSLALLAAPGGVAGPARNALAADTPTEA